MANTIDCTPHPALGIAHQCIQELKGSGHEFEFEGEPLLDIARVLMVLERKGALIFTDETAPGNETSRPATSFERVCTDKLRVVLSSLCTLPDDVIDDVMSHEHVRDAIHSAEALFGEGRS